MVAAEVEVEEEVLVEVKWIPVAMLIDRIWSVRDGIMAASPETNVIIYSTNMDMTVTFLYVTAKQMYVYY